MAPATSSDADIIFARANVALARSQRLIASWLPPRTDSKLNAAKSEEELEREEQEIFTPVPELLGLGATPPSMVQEGDFRRQEVSSNDKLRKQLLGKELAKKYGHGKLRNGGIGNLESQHSSSKPRPQAPKRAGQETDDGDGEDGTGRSSLGRTKRKRLQGDSPREHGKDEQGGVDGPVGEGGEMHLESDRSKKQAKSYLDEVLEEKRRKKKKKKKNKHAGKGEANAP